MINSDELNKFIYDITGNYDIYIKEFPDLEKLEVERISKIRIAINILIKEHDNKQLTNEEISLLEKYKYYNNLNYDIEKSICYLVAKIDEEYSNKAYLLYIKAYNTKMNKRILDNSWKYIYNLRNNFNDLFHSITHNHEISILDVHNKCIKPKIKFKKDKKRRFF